MTARVLVLYYSRHGATQQLADAIADGIASVGGEALMRTVTSAGEPASQRDLTVTLADLEQCDALIMGSPTRFGHMASALQQFWESSSSAWLRGVLVDKPGAVFTSSSSMHACTAPALGQTLGAGPQGDRDDSSCGQQQKGGLSEASSTWIVGGHPFDTAR